MKAATLTCIVTGRDKKFYSFSLKNKCKKHGSLDEFRRFYVCREAAKLLKARVQPEDVQKQLLPKGKKPFEIDLVILARLKLLKRRKKEFHPETNTALTVSRWKLDGAIRSATKWTSRQAYIEWLTGGANKCQVPLGGTCWYTQVRIDNGGFCDNCEFVKYCLCRLRKIKK